MIYQISNIIATVMSIPNEKIFCHPLRPLFMFLEDYWYYKYHDRNYSINMKVIFASISFINDKKLTLTFINFSTLHEITSLKKVLTNNYK